jgi:hypothetical protein
MARGSETARHCLGSRPAARSWPTARERIAEIAEILAAGLMRLSARKSSPKSADFGESSVDFSPHQSGHADPSSPDTRP